MINRALLMRCAKAPEVCCMHDWWIALTASCFGIIEFIAEGTVQIPPARK